MVANGAIVERDLQIQFTHKRELIVNLFQPDFTTSYRVADSINSYLGENAAKALDPSRISVKLSKRHRDYPVRAVSEIENLEVTVDTRAVVVVNERTGTVVMGQNVRISTVAVAHGTLNIEIKETPQVVQPAPLSEGRTVVVPRTQIYVSEEENKMLLMPEGVTIGEVVRALNSIGATPRDLIAILQSIKAAGALQAELQLI